MAEDVVNSVNNALEEDSIRPKICEPHKTSEDPTEGRYPREFEYVM